MTEPIIEKKRERIQKRKVIQMRSGSSVTGTTIAQRNMKKRKQVRAVDKAASPMGVYWSASLTQADGLYSRVLLLFFIQVDDAASIIDRSKGVDILFCVEVLFLAHDERYVQRRRKS